MEQEVNEKHTTRNILIGVLIVVILLILGIIGYFFFMRGGTSSGTSAFTSLFGSLGTSDTPANTTINPGNGNTNTTDTGNTSGEPPLFLQLADFPVAGGTVVTHDGKEYVRFVKKEDGNIYEADPTTGKNTQITNTTIPRIQEAFFGNNGDTVVLRYLARDPITQIESIKTYLADITLSADAGTLGSITGDFLPDNISEVSVSPDGTKLFYLLPIPEGVSGSIVNIKLHTAQELFRNAFSEWLPQLLNNGKVVLTTKASANVPGFSYIYNPADRSLTRILREKNALTTNAGPLGKDFLYSENVLGNAVLGLFSPQGFTGDEGQSSQTIPLSLSTLPEKCFWEADGMRVFCAAFNSTPRVMIPDEWYQGTVSFADTFWTVDTKSLTTTYLADPNQEIHKTFDVITPFTDTANDHFFFVDKNDETLWSMRIQKEKYTGSGVNNENTQDTTLTPDELKDAAGSVPATSN